MKFHLLILALVMTVTACNEINDLRPADPGAVPDVVVQVVKGKYPAATDLTLKTLVNQAVWEARFKVDADSFTSLVNRTEMFETFRAAPDSSAKLLPELLPLSSFNGGKLSANTEDAAFENTGQKRHKLQYAFNGANYQFDALYYRGTNYKPAVAVFETQRYRIILQDQNALTKEIQDYLAARPGLSFKHVEAWIGLNDEKMFLVRVQFKTSWGKDELGDLLLTEKAELKWMSPVFNAPQVYKPESNIETLPAPILNVLAQSPELANFRFVTPEQDKWQSEFEGIKSYYLNLSNKNGAERCVLYFDGNGALLFKRYFVSF